MIESSFIRNLENSLNKPNLNNLKSIFYDNILENFNKLINDFPNAKFKITNKNIKKNDKNIIHIKVKETKKLNNDTYILESNYDYIFSLKNNKIIDGISKNIFTTIRNDQNKIDLSFYIPDNVLTGSKYDIDVILNKPLEETIIAGVIKPYQEKEILLELEPLASGGIFKITRAPSKPGIQIWSGILAHPDGIISFTKSINLLDDLNTNNRTISGEKGFLPYYYFPSEDNLKKQALYIGKNAYQLLYFGQIKDSLNLAKLAVKINETNEKLWLILSEAQISNKEYKNALNSLEKAENINSKLGEIYFAKSNVYLEISQQTKAKSALEKGITIEPNNHKAFFQLGNILLMEKNYEEAIKMFDKSINIKPDFWQAINNKALAYFEKNNINQSIKFLNQQSQLRKILNHY